MSKLTAFPDRNLLSLGWHFIEKSREAPFCILCGSEAPSLASQDALCYASSLAVGSAALPLGVGLQTCPLNPLMVNSGTNHPELAQTPTRLPLLRCQLHFWPNGCKFGGSWHPLRLDNLLEARTELRKALKQSQFYYKRPRSGGPVQWRDAEGEVCLGRNTERRAVSSWRPRVALLAHHVFTNQNRHGASGSTVFIGASWQKHD